VYANLGEGREQGAGSRGAGRSAAEIPPNARHLLREGREQGIEGKVSWMRSKKIEI